jgi:hypothetical protein
MQFNAPFARRWQTLEGAKFNFPSLFTRCRCDSTANARLMIPAQLRRVPIVVG